MDCPEDVAAYIHRVGRTALYLSGGKSVLFLMPSEMKMLKKLEEKKIPIRFIKVLFLILLNMIKFKQHLHHVLFLRV